jgi:hypothetical protein
MDLFRVGHDVYGQRVLEGISWDLLPYAAGVAAVVIVVHQVYRLISGSGRNKRGAR